MQMSQVLADIGAGAHTTPLPSHGACGGQRYLSGRNRLEESPQAAVALKGDVPILGSRCICSGRVYRGLLCRNRVGFSPDVESALMSTLDHSKIAKKNHRTPILL